jgi:lipoate-protein ligase A
VRLLAAVKRFWRLIRDGAGEAAWNMAVDEAILEEVIAGRQPPTVRFYRWAEPSVSLGRLQRPEKVVNLSLCRQRGIAIVQRLTGGKAVLHGHDLTLCVVAPLRCFAPAHRVIDIHLRLVQALAAGFARLGVTTRAATQAHRQQIRGSHANCFAHALPGDLTTHEGVKLVGGAQYRRANVIMEQISIPAAPLPASLRDVLQPWHEPTISPLVGVPWDQLVAALQAGFASEFGVEWRPAALSPAEVASAEALRARYLYLEA